MITIISDWLWERLWILILIASIISWMAFKKLQWIDHRTDQEKTNNHQLFFISMAGSVGLGNIFLVMEGVKFYGSSIIIWLWVGVLLGRFLKFWEIYLSLKYKNHNFAGGPLYISKILHPWISHGFSLCLLLYCIETFQFGKMVNVNASMIHYYFPQLQLSYILYGVGIIILLLWYKLKNRNEFIHSSSALMKIFLWGYIIIFILITINSWKIIPIVIKNIFYDFFKPLPWKVKILPIMAGIRTAIYTNDVAVGYEGLMQKYATVQPKNYISYGYNIIKSNIFDAGICTISGLLILFYTTYKNIDLSRINVDNLVVDMFNYIIPWNLGFLIYGILIFCVAFTTIATYSQAGSLLFSYYLPHLNNNIFYSISAIIFLLTLSLPIPTLYGLMTLAGGIIIFINCCSILKFLYNNYKSLDQW